MHPTISSESYYNIILSVKDKQNVARQISIIPELFIDIISKSNIIDMLQFSLVNKAWNNWICRGSSTGTLRGIKEIRQLNVEIKGLQEKIKMTKYSWFRETITHLNADLALTLFKPMAVCIVPTMPLLFLDFFLAQPELYQITIAKFQAVSFVLIGGAIVSGITYKIFSHLNQKEKAKEKDYNFFTSQIKTIKLDIATRCCDP